MIEDDLYKRMLIVQSALDTEENMFAPDLFENTDAINLECFELHCTRCRCQSVVKKKRRGRKSKPVEDMTDLHYQSKRLRLLLNTLHAICGATNQRLFDLVQLWFEKRDGRDDFLAFAENIVQRNKKIELQLQSLLSAKKIVTPDDIIFVRDRIFLSDSAYFDFYNTTNLNSLFPSSTICSKRRSMWNGIVKERFHMQPLPDGHSCSVEVLLELFVALSMKEKKPIASDKLRIKISLDGRNIAFGQVALSITPLNIPIFKTQAPSSAFCFAILEGSESKELVADNVDVLMHEINDLQSSGIEFNMAGHSMHFDVEFVWSSDLKSLGIVSKLNDGGRFCPFCDLLRNDRSELDRSRFCRRTNLENIFGIETNQHTICILHAKQRIVERLILLLTNGIQSRIVEIIRRIRNLHGLNRFNIQPKPGNSLVNIRVDMLTGAQCDTILKNYLSILGDDEPPLVKAIWKQSCVILLDYMEATNEMLVGYDPKVLSTILDEWATNLRAVYGCKAFSFYVHIIYGHLPDLLSCGSLQPFSGQGFEHSHKEHRVAWSRLTSNGGAVSTARQETNPIEQLLLWQNRKLLLAYEVIDKQWSRVHKRRTKTVEVNHIEERKQYLSLFDYMKVQVDDTERIQENEMIDLTEYDIFGDELLNGLFDDEGDQLTGGPLFDLEETQMTSYSLLDDCISQDTPSNSLSNDGDGSECRPKKKRKFDKEISSGQQIQLVLQLNKNQQVGLASCVGREDHFIVGEGTVLDCSTDGHHTFLFSHYAREQYVLVRLDKRFKRKMKPPFLEVGSLDDYLGKVLIWDRDCLGCEISKNRS